MTGISAFGNFSVAVERPGPISSHVQAFDTLTEALDVLFDGLIFGDGMPLSAVLFRYPDPPRIITADVIAELDERQREREVDERHRQARRIA